MLVIYYKPFLWIFKSTDMTEYHVYVFLWFLIYITLINDSSEYQKLKYILSACG